MSTHLAITFDLLDERFHGRASGRAPEWPPSPFRAWQALVAAAGALTRGGQGEGLWPALEALERAPPPTIVAPRGRLGNRVVTYVPNNDGDLIGRSRGERAVAELRTAKVVSARALEHGRIHYLWNAEGLVSYLPALQQTARAVACLGWGVDLAVGDAQILNEATVLALPGQRWVPAPRGATPLRAPSVGSLADLERRFVQFLHRTATDQLSPPGPPGVFAIVAYATEGAAPVDYAAFVLRSPDGRTMASFDAANSGLRLAGMTRGAVAAAARAQGLPEQTINARVFGHEADGGHLAYVPLPTLEFRGIDLAPVLGPARRVLVLPSGPAAREAATWAAEGLIGAELINTRGELRAVLEPAAAEDPILRLYTQPACVWATVTPLLLPGHEDKDGLLARLRDPTNSEQWANLREKLDARIDRLLRKAIVQAGLGAGLAAHALLEWQDEPYWRGASRVERYGVPNHARGSRALHVRVRWRDERGEPVKVEGPIVLGRSRFTGGGLFVGVPER